MLNMNVPLFSHNKEVLLHETEKDHISVSSFLSRKISNFAIYCYTVGNVIAVMPFLHVIEE